MGRDSVLWGRISYSYRIGVRKRKKVSGNPLKPEIKKASNATRLRLGGEKLMKEGKKGRLYVRGN